MRPARVAAFAFAFVAVAASSRAQSTAAAAEALYREGQRLINAGNVHEACLRFGESEKQDPTIATLVALAACHEREGKTATAWGEYTEVAGKDGPAGKYARDRAKVLEPMLLKLTFETDLDPPPGLELKIDAQTFGAGVLRSEIPVDPGEHRLEASAPGKKPWQTTITITDGSSPLHVKIALEDAPPPPPIAAPIEPPPISPPVTTPPHDVVTPGSPVKRGVGFGLLGAGAVALGVAGFYTATAISDNDKYGREQGPHLVNGSGQTWKDISNSATTDAIAIGAPGLVAVVVGIILVATSGEKKEAATNVGVTPLLPFGAFSGGGGVAAHGAF